TLSVGWDYSSRDGEEDSIYLRVGRAFMGAAGRKLRTPRAENRVVWDSRSVRLRKTRADCSPVVAMEHGPLAGAPSGHFVRCSDSSTYAAEWNSAGRAD